MRNATKKKATAASGSTAKKGKPARPEVRKEKKTRSRAADRVAKIKFLTREQVRQFFAVVDAKKDKALLLLLYKRGLRASEPGLLLVDDYDRKAGKLYVRRVKGSFSGRHILQRDEVRALNAWLKEREGRGIESDYLFPGYATTGLGVSRTAVFEMVKRYAVRAGLPKDKQHPHMLKHSVATHLLEVGADVRDVQDALGHAEIDSTLIYAAITNKRRDKTAREIVSKLPCV